MAIISTPYPISGSAGNATFRNLGGQTALNLKRKYDHQHYLESPRCARQRRNAREFGGASAAKGQFYRHLRLFGSLLAPYTHNALLTEILAAARSTEPTFTAERGLPQVERFTAKNCATALTGLDLTQARRTKRGHLPQKSAHIRKRSRYEPEPVALEAKAHLTFARPYGTPVHAPTRLPQPTEPGTALPIGEPVRRARRHVPLAGGVTVGGLREAAAVLQAAHPKKEFSCRIHVLYVPFVDVIWDGEEYRPVTLSGGKIIPQSTGWIPAEGLPATIPLKLKTPAEACTDGLAYVAITVVEWMSHHGRRERYHHDAASVLVLGTLHPDLPDTPPAIRHPKRGYNKATRAKARNPRPRASAKARAALAIAQFDHGPETSLPGGPRGRYANPKWTPLKPRQHRPARQAPESRPIARPPE